MLILSQKELKSLIMLLFLGGIIYFLTKLGKALLPFALGIILAYLLFPLINFLRKRGVSFSVIIYLLFLAIAIFLIFNVFVIFPLLIAELENLTEMLPAYTQEIEEYLSKINSLYQRTKLPLIFKEAIDRSLKHLEEEVISLIEGVTGGIIDSLPIIFSVFIAPIISYYLIKDGRSLKRGILIYIPRSKRKLFLRITKDINNIFIAYLRGQIWLSLVVSILTAVGLLALQVKFFIILGLLAGITNMIPYIGPIIGAMPAIFVALTHSHLKALGVTLLFLFIQQLESSIIGPKILSEEVGLHPLTIIFALLAGAELFGLWGLLLAVPLAGSLKIISRLFLRSFLLK